MSREISIGLCKKHGIAEYEVNPIFSLNDSDAKVACEAYREHWGCDDSCNVLWALRCPNFTGVIETFNHLSDDEEKDLREAYADLATPFSWGFGVTL